MIKVEHPVRGDAQRGLCRVGAFEVGPTRNPILEHANRSKPSVGLDLSKPAGQALLLELARGCDVVMTYHLPAQRRRLGVELEGLRRANPSIIYVRGSAHGEKGRSARSATARPTARRSAPSP